MLVVLLPVLLAGAAGAMRLGSLPSDEIRSRGSVARAKCQEYSQYVVTTSTVVVTEQPPATTLPTTDAGNQTDETVNVVSITNGKPAQSREFPHMALIGSGEEDDVKYSCGGSLISPDFVLTAAHCLTRDTRWVLLGALNRSMVEDGSPEPQLIEVGQLVRHPDYKLPALYNDIALLRLKRSADINSHVWPACLHTERTIDREEAVATGWGDTYYGEGALQDHLLKAVLPLHPYSVCNTSYSTGVTQRAMPRGVLDESQLCSGDLKENKDTCQGDSGGPLQIFTPDDEMYRIVGVTSFGKFCGSSSPGIYTRVSHFVPWIESIVWPKEN